MIEFDHKGEHYKLEERELFGHRHTTCTRVRDGFWCGWADDVEAARAKLDKHERLARPLGQGTLL